MLIGYVMDLCCKPYDYMSKSDAMDTPVGKPFNSGRLRKSVTKESLRNGNGSLRPENSGRAKTMQESYPGLRPGSDLRDCAWRP